MRGLCLQCPAPDGPLRHLHHSEHQGFNLRLLDPSYSNSNPNNQFESRPRRRPHLRLQHDRTAPQQLPAMLWHKRSI